jgi:thioredoxin-like negative regulator of GroEL
MVMMQFSTAFCAPCRSTRAVCAHLAATTEGVRHVEVDAESRLDLVREMGVEKTPTVFVLRDGEVCAKAEGAQTLASMRALLGRVSRGRARGGAAPAA